MPLQVDVWAGDLHQNHVGTFRTQSWDKAAKFMQRQIEGGMLCNVLHTDFKAPPERVKEAEAALAATLNK